MATTALDATTDSLYARLGSIAEEIHYVEGGSGTPPHSNFDKINDPEYNRRYRRMLMEYAERVTIDRIANAFTLERRTLRDAIRVWTTQAKADGRGFVFTENTIGGANEFATASAGGSNTGTHKLVFACINSVGDNAWAMFTETLTAECTGTSITNPQSISSGEEEFHVRGEGWVPGWHENWPRGSGADLKIRLAHGGQDAWMTPGKNILTNSDFEDFTSSNPDQWTAVTGVASTNWRSDTTALRGSTALEIDGDGSTLVELRQVFNSGASGTIARLKPRTVYACGFWVRDDGSAPAAGALRVSVQDGTNDDYATDVLEVDPFNTAQSTITASTSVDLTTVGSTYAFQSFVFVTPGNVPAGSDIHIELTTAITAGRDVYVDGLVVQEMTPCYGNGVWVAGFAGATNPLIGDIDTIAAAQAGANINKDEMVYQLRRMFDWKALGANEHRDRIPITLAMNDDGVDSAVTDADYFAEI